MHASWLNKVQLFFTPDHKKPVDEHIVRDQTTRKVIADTEEFLIRIAKNAPSHNKRLSIRRKQKEWLIKVKINHKFITIIMMDLKQSSSPIKKRIIIKCYRRYVKAKNGVGECKEATIRYIKDGKSQIRSILHSPLFHSIFYQIHHLDLVFSNEQMNTSESSVQQLENQQALLQTTNSSNVAMLVDELNRYVKSVERFTIDPVIIHRLQQITKQANKLQDDFSLLEFEERHVVRRMLREDIPSLLHAYLSLSLKHQLEQKENVFLALSKMELTLMDYVEHLEKLRVERMEFLLQLQTIRYNK